MLRIATYLIAWLAFLIAAVALAARFAPVVNHAVLAVAALSPYLTLGAGIAAALLLLVRRWLVAAACLALAAVAIAVQSPRLVAAAPAADHGIPVRVLTVNVRNGAADARALVTAASKEADVVLLQELPPQLALSLSQAGLDSEFPHSAVDARDYAAGVGIWSRYPIIRSSRERGYELGLADAWLRVPGATSDLVVVSAHLVGPWPQDIEPWRREIASLTGTLAKLAGAAGSGAVIVAGDFNATADMAPFRDLLGAGYRDAAEQAGAGLNPTFPAEGALPPLIGIDHILSYNGSATDVHTVKISGSDHLGLRATVFIPG